MKGEMNPSRRESGQSLVELTMVFLFLMLLLAGVADIGRAIFTYITLRDAAQEGAAFATIYRIYTTEAIDCGAIEARARGTSSDPVDLQSSDVQVDITLGGVDCSSATEGSACYGNEVVVRVRYDNFPLVTPFLGIFVGSQTVPISASVEDTVLTPACGP